MSAKGTPAHEIMTPRKFFLLGALFITVIFFPASAELNHSQTDDGKILFSNGSYWIKWDPVGDHILGDPLVIRGTTNLTAGSTLYYEFFTPASGCHQKICNMKPPGTKGIIQIYSQNRSGVNAFSTSINTTVLQSNYYYLWFSLNSKVPKESDAFVNSPSFFVYPEILLFPDDVLPPIESGSLTKPDDTGVHYWISFPYLANVSSAGNQLIGFTNLPVGQKLSYSQFIPVETGYTPNVNPIRIDTRNRTPGGTVVPGERPGINKVIIPMNSTELRPGSTIIVVWNPRFNPSDRIDSISSSATILYLTSGKDIPVVSPTQDTEIPPSNSTFIPLTKTPASPLSWSGASGAILIILCYVMRKLRD